MDFEFREGIGTGTFTTADYSFSGSIKNTAFEKDVPHGHCVITYNDGEMRECEYDTGIAQSITTYHEKEGWRYTMYDQFETDQHFSSHLINGVITGNNKFYSLINIKVKD